MSNQLLRGPMRTIQVTMPIKLVTALERSAKRRKISRAKLLRNYSIIGLEREANSKNGKADGKTAK